MSARREAKQNQKRAALATENLTRSWRLDPRKMQWAFDHSGQELVTDPIVKDEMVFGTLLAVIKAAIMETRMEMDRAYAAGEVDRRVSDDEVVYASMTIMQGYTHEQWAEWVTQLEPAIDRAVEDSRRRFRS